MRSIQFRISRAGKQALALAFLAMTSLPGLFAQTPDAQPEAMVPLDGGFQKELTFILYCLVIIIILLAYIALMASAKDPYSVSFKRIIDSVTGRDSVTETTDHVYDGIVELDNPMPYWLRIFFWGTIVFGIGYMAHYHVFGTGDGSIALYEQEMAAAAAQYKDTELPDDKLVLVTEKSRLEAAASIFNANCIACHGAKGEGGVGPNLTDAYWVHGGTVAEIYKTITNGVPAKGMISWQKQITSRDRLAIASWILGLQGTNPPNAKQPEGVMAGQVAADSTAAPAAADSTAGDSAAAAPHQP